MITSTNLDRDSTEDDELVTLVHGFGSKRLWMRSLERRLRRAGYATLNWSYVSLRGSLEVHARRLRGVLDESSRVGSRVHLVAHSMGAIVARLALSYGCLPHLGRVVLISPPNHGSPVARFFAPVIGSICPAVSELSSRSDSFVNRIEPSHGVQVGVIGARFDFLIPLSSTMLAGQTDHICLTATHNSLLFQPTAARYVHTFISTGRFDHIDDGPLI